MTSGLPESNAEKSTRIKDIDSIETGKTVFGGKITISQEDYVNVTDLAKKQIAAESKDNELATENAILKEKNATLAKENKSFRETTQSVRSLHKTLVAVQRELSDLKSQYRRTVEFVESLGLKERLDRFLHPYSRKIIK